MPGGSVSGSGAPGRTPASVLHAAATANDSPLVTLGGTADSVRPGPSPTAAQSPHKAASVERFLSVVKDVLAAQEIDRNKHFLDVGGDSLDAVIVSEAILGEFGIGPELDWFFE